MSWPADDQPRLLVRELEGYPITTSGRISSRTATHLSATIIDRAYCCRVVWRLSSEQVVYVPGFTGSARRETRRAFVHAQATQALAAMQAQLLEQRCT